MQAIGLLIQGPLPSEIYSPTSDGFSLIHRDTESGALNVVESYPMPIPASGLVFSENGNFAVANANGQLLTINRSGDSSLSFVSSLNTTDLINGFTVVSQGGLHYSADRKFVYQRAERRDPNGIVPTAQGIIYFSFDQSNGSIAFENAYWADQNGFSSLSSLHTMDVTPDGGHLYAAEFSFDNSQNRITIFERNQVDGSLTIKPSGGVIEVGSLANGSERGAVTLKFVSDTTAYMSTHGGLSILSRDPNSGVLRRTKEILQTAFAGATDVQYASEIVPSPDGQRVYTVVGSSLDGGFSGEITEYMRSNDGTSLILSKAGQEDRTFIVFRSLFVSSDSKHVYALRSGGDNPGLVVYERTPDERAISLANELVDDGSNAFIPDNPSAAVAVGNRDVYIGGADNITLLHRDTTTRELAFVELLNDNSQFLGHTVRHLQADPTGTFIYAGLTNGDVVALQRDASSGSLNAVSGSRIAANYGTSILVTDTRVFTFGRDPNDFSGSLLSIFTRNASGTLTPSLEVRPGDVFPGGTIPFIFRESTLALSADGQQIYASSLFSDLVVLDISDEGFDFLETHTQNSGNFFLPFASPDGKHVYELPGPFTREIRVFPRNLDGTLGSPKRAFSRTTNLEAPWSLVHFQNGFGGVVMSDDGLAVHTLAFRENGSTVALHTFSRNEASGLLEQQRMQVQGFDGIQHMDLQTPVTSHSAISISSDGDVVVASGLEDAAIAFKVPPPPPVPPQMFNVTSNIDLSERGLDLSFDFSGFKKSADDQHLYLTGSKSSTVDGDAFATQPLLHFHANSSTGIASFQQSFRIPGDRTGDIGQHSSIMLTPDDSELHLLVEQADSGQNGYLDHFSRNPTTGSLTFESSINSSIDSPDNIGLEDAEAAAMSPDGKHIYVASSRNERSVLVYARQANGSLQFVQKILQSDLNDATEPFFLNPRFIRFSPDNRFVYVFDQQKLHLFSRDTINGTLSYINSPSETSGFPSVSIFIDATISDDGRHMYVGNGQGLMWFKRNTQNGELVFQSLTGEGAVSPRDLHIINDGHRIMALMEVDIDPGSTFDFVHAVVFYDRDAATGEITFQIDDRLESAQNGAPEFRASRSFLEVDAQGEFAWLAAHNFSGTSHVVSFAIDTDKDQIIDAHDLDIDNDTLLNTYERSVGLNPYSAQDATKDHDNDGLNAIEEARFGTNPFNRDTDKDGISDGNEVAAGTDPLVDPDSDNDGLLDSVERSVGLNPFNGTDADLDQDDDGLTAREEVAIGTDPFKADTDADGVNDGDEVAAGTNPKFNLGSIAPVISILLD